MFFFEAVRDEALPEDELKQVMINSLYYSETDILKRVANKDVIDFGKLPDRQAVRDFYTERGITAKRAEFISASYDVKVRLLKKLIRG